MRTPEHLITTPDGLIVIYYNSKDRRRTIKYVDLSDNEYHLGTIRDGRFIYMDGT